MAVKKIKDVVVPFFQGRYGVDKFSKFLTRLSIVLLILGLLFGLWFFILLGLAIIIYSDFRIFSMKFNKRYMEEQAYINFVNKLKFETERRINICKDLKVNKIVKCPNCGQKIRLPRKKGKISIRCSTCNIEFIKRT